MASMALLAFITFLHNCGWISSMQRLISSCNARVIVGLLTLTSNNSIRRNLMVLNHTIWGQFWSPKRESTRLGNVSCNNWIVSLVVRHVASSCWNHIWATSISSNFGRKNCVIVLRYRTPLTVAAWPASFSKKYNPMMPLAQNPQWHIVGAFVFR